MSSQMMVKAWEVEGLLSSERLVLLALAECSDREGRNAFRSESSIADHVKLSERTVKRCIQSLKVARLIAIQELPTHRRSTTYQLFPDGPVSSVGDLRSGDSVTPHDDAVRGDSLTPPGVTRGVTAGVTAGVTNRQIPHTPYKEEPVEPVDPDDPSGSASALQRLLTKFALEGLTTTPTATGASLLDHLRLIARSRGYTPTPAEFVGAVDAALALARRTA